MKKSVNVFGQNISIVKKNNLLKDEDAYGLYDPSSKTIYIDEDLPPNTARETLIHECGHALFHRAGLSQSKIASDLEEIIVEQFTIMFVENFMPKISSKPKTTRQKIAKK